MPPLAAGANVLFCHCIQPWLGVRHAATSSGPIRFYPENRSYSHGNTRKNTERKVNTDMWSFAQWVIPWHIFLVLSRGFCRQNKDIHGFCPCFFVWFRGQSRFSGLLMAAAAAFARSCMCAQNGHTSLLFATAIMYSGMAMASASATARHGEPCSRFRPMLPSAI